eukprot:TRINITY_DN10384_c0_g1_i2.p1 TRINITY_DN10384_c0_g1~~TRINITY_DN10384_c0_g1_i2.p1  ORF type:complete len:1262 (+),score=154.53 TRINITY_DN10384_c0_g1_i2:73-3858(+)
MVRDKWCRRSRTAAVAALLVPGVRAWCATGWDQFDHRCYVKILRATASNSAACSYLGAVEATVSDQATMTWLQATYVRGCNSVPPLVGLSIPGIQADCTDKYAWKWADPAGWYNPAVWSPWASGQPAAAANGCCSVLQCNGLETRSCAAWHDRICMTKRLRCSGGVLAATAVVLKVGATTELLRTEQNVQPQTCWLRCDELPSCTSASFSTTGECRLWGNCRVSAGCATNSDPSWTHRDCIPVPDAPTMAPVPLQPITPFPTPPPTTPPTRAPTAAPTAPTPAPSRQPTSAPTFQPTRRPSPLPSAPPIAAPSYHPSGAPSGPPAPPPSAAPTLPPVVPPTFVPSGSPTPPPAASPTARPSARPSPAPSALPSAAPPTLPPTANTPLPSAAPSAPPQQPSAAPTRMPSLGPTAGPSQSAPSAPPSPQPTKAPTNRPSAQPSRPPSVVPSWAPARDPSTAPSLQPSAAPSQGPSAAPSQGPSAAPSQGPSIAPSVQPSVPPSAQPSAVTSGPTNQSEPPHRAPSRQPASSRPSAAPSQPPSAPASLPPSWAIRPRPPPTAPPAAASHFPGLTEGPATAPAPWPTARPSPAPGNASREPAGRPTPAPSARPARGAELPTLAPSLGQNGSGNSSSGGSSVAGLEAFPTAPPTSATFRAGVSSRAAGASGVLLFASPAAMSAGAAGHAQRLGLLAQLPCAEGDAEWLSIPESLHPTQVRISGSAHAGAVVVNVGLWLAIAVVARALLVPLSFWNWRQKGDDGARASIMYPSAVAFGCFLLQCGTFYSACWLLLRPGVGMWAVGGFGALACLVWPVPFYIAVRRGVPEHGRNREVELPDRAWLKMVVRFVCSDAEWVSRTRGYTWHRHYRALVEPFRTETAWYWAVDASSLCALGLAAAVPTSTMTECGHVRLGLALVHLLLLVLEVRHWPHLRYRDSMTDFWCLGANSCALGLLAGGFYSGTDAADHWSFGAAETLFDVQMPVLAAKMLLDCVMKLHRWRSKRHRPVQEAEYRDSELGGSLGVSREPTTATRELTSAQDDVLQFNGTGKSALVLSPAGTSTPMGTFSGPSAADALFRSFAATSDGGAQRTAPFEDSADPLEALRAPPRRRKSYRRRRPSTASQSGDPVLIVPPSGGAAAPPGSATSNSRRRRSRTCAQPEEQEEQGGSADTGERRAGSPALDDAAPPQSPLSPLPVRPQQSSPFAAGGGRLRDRDRSRLPQQGLASSAVGPQSPASPTSVRPRRRAGRTLAAANRRHSELVSALV